ncbi:kinase-like protein [Pyrenochaeta sp. DS3sAY3a]|nr:kinase-like protein [Pyrenochaeta sp. DS3sAY3a]
MDELRLALQHLRHSKCETGSNGTLNFVPEPDLVKLITRDTVMRALEDPAFKLKQHQYEPIATEVDESARKLFSILVELRLEKFLKSCLEKNITDATLPILEEPRLESLVPESATHFEKLQWEYFPLKLRENTHKDLEPKRILPYIANEPLSFGGSSAVFKVKIHSWYCSWNASMPGSHYVRKEISSSTSDEAQRKESDLLFLLRTIQNDNIIRLLTSYTQNGFCNLLFPVADLDLHDLLLTRDQPGWIYNPSIVFDSFRGLANGLHYLHNFQPKGLSNDEANRVTNHGYHHDIKPRNILLMGSRMILADFGLARLKEATEASITTWKNTPPTFAAPEARDPVTLQARSIGRAYDMWSIGCVLSEFATYCIGGTEAVKEFRKERIREGPDGAHNCFHHNGKVNTAVHDWHRILLDRNESPQLCSMYASSLSLLVENPKDRPSSEWLVQELNKASLLQRLRSILEITRIENSSDSVKSSRVYDSKLVLERNRLRAWGHAIGLSPVNQQTQPWISPNDRKYEEFHRLLEDCHTKLAEIMPQQLDDLVFQHQILDMISLTNNSLLLEVSSSIRTTIENTFNVLTVTDMGTVEQCVGSVDGSFPLTTVQGDQDEIQPPFQNMDANLLAAARYASIAFSSANSPGARDRVNTIDTALLANATSQTKHASPLQLRWYYRGYRERDRQKVLIEERTYEGEWTNDPESDKFQDLGKEVLDRIQELGQLFQMQPKPRKMRLLNSLGMYHEPSLRKFGFVYEFPAVSKDTEPVSLRTIIEETKMTEKNPTLDNKFAIANAIVNCTHALHLTGWMHKAIRSSNIILFQEPGQDLAKVNLALPYLTGFHHSRQSKPGAYSSGATTIGEKAFFHPTYLNGEISYCHAFDYYALGIVLLEIAIWRTMNKMIDGVTSIHKVKPLLLQHAKTYVPQRMGTAYSEVVVACLEFHDRHSVEENLPDLLMVFQKEIQERLDNIAATFAQTSLHPGSD